MFSLNDTVSVLRLLEYFSFRIFVAYLLKKKHIRIASDTRILISMPIPILLIPHANLRIYFFFK